MILISPLKAETFSRIFCCKPRPAATDKIMITIPAAMAAIAILIIGAETLPLLSLEAMMRRAVKSSKFTDETVA